VTGRGWAPSRLDTRRRWSLVVLVAVLGMLVSLAFATGLLGGSGGAPVRRAVAPTTVPSPDAAAPAPTATPAAAVAMSRSVPVRLRIPAIGVDSSLMHLGLKSNGTLGTPPGAFPAGWFTGGPTPGEIGPAIIVGHVRYVTPGVFARLTDLRPGDAIMVERRDGRTADFRVTRLAHFAKSAFPTRRVYGNIDHAGLRLITCGGLDAETNVFEENVVVFADLARSRQRSPLD
jgi:sortase (surface protein transpeptidase)